MRRRALPIALLAAGLFAASAANAAGARTDGGVQFFTDEAAFDAALGVPLELTIEHFDGGAAVGPFPATCGEPFDSSTNNECFARGQLADGFALTSSSGAGLVVFPPRFLGANATSRIVGATTFADSTIVSFAPTVSGAAAEVYNGTSPTSPVDVEVFDANGVSLGSTVVAAAPTRDIGQFIGVVSATPIGKITFNGEGGTAELIDDLQFRPAGLLPPGVALAFAPSGVPANSPATLTLTLGNQAQPGTATLTADLADTLPNGLVVAPNPNATTTCASGTVSAIAGASAFSLGAGAQIPGAGTCTVSVDVTAASAGLYTNTLAAGALVTDLGDNADAASATLTVSTGQANTFPPAENFDEVFAPALPTGWTSSTTTGGNDWTTVTDQADSAPNAAFAPDPLVLGDYTLDSPAFTPTAGQTVSFRHRYNLERGFDGAVFEISIDGGEFADILSAGGHFITGGYAGVTISESTGSPIAGRAAWTGDSSEFVTTTVALPAAAANHSTRIRFRTADDVNGLTPTSPMGWWIDSIVLGVAGPQPSATIAPASLSFQLDPGAQASQTVTLSNATGADALTYAIENRSMSATRPRLVPYASVHNAKQTKALAGSKPLVERPAPTLGSFGGNPARHAAGRAWMPEGSLLLTLDDGTAESSLGTGTGSFDPPVPFAEYAAIWLNRFRADDALTIHAISVFWPEPSMAGGDLLGLQANLVVYYDADGDGDPSNAVRVGTDTLVSITATGNFATYPTEFSVPGAGDVYIGFVDQWSLAGGFTPRLYPAAIDEDSPQGMSYFSSVNQPPVDIVNLANNDFNEPFTNANLMIRAAVTGGGGGGPCSGPLASWLSATPASGSLEGGASASIAVTVDAGAGQLAAGEYHAALCISSNDAAQPLIAIPVDVIVGTPPATPCSGSDEIFCDGFESSGGNGGTIVRGSVDQDVTDSQDGSAFDFTSGSFHPYDASITSDDVNLYDFGDGTLTVYWYGDAVPGGLQAGGVADDSGTTIAVLHSGDSIGPDSPLWGSTQLTDWYAGSDGYLGVAFYNESTGALNYGYLHLTTSGPSGFPAHVLDWAYDTSGAAITIP